MIARVRLNEDLETSKKSARIERVRRKPTIKSGMTFVPPRMARLGQAMFLEGEEADDYDEIFTRVRATVRPVDFIEEIFVDDAVSSQWDVLRWRRYKMHLLRTCGFEALTGFLYEELDIQHFADHLTKVIRDVLPEKEAEALAKTLAHEVAGNKKPGALVRVTRILAEQTNLEADEILNDARRLKVEELVREYAQWEPGAVTLIHELLVRAGKSMGALESGALAEEPQDTPGIDFLTLIERIEHLITIAVRRRNDALREIERHRSVFGAALRRAVQQVEDADFEVIDTTSAKGKSAA
jgi:hypothetical protein